MATELDSGLPASARPTGTVTLLFSDIEGSTVRWERDRKAMAAGKVSSYLLPLAEAAPLFCDRCAGDARISDVRSTAYCQPVNSSSLGPLLLILVKLDLYVKLQLKWA